jgi:thiamine-phosphate pyrophosphorylase
MSVRLDPKVLRTYLVTDRELCGERGVAAVVAAAVRGGVSCVQLREKAAPTRDMVMLGLSLKAVLQAHGVPLVINDRIDVALACSADGVHLGQTDMPAPMARRLLPDHMFIGWSVETLDQVTQAMAWPSGTVDYLGVSPVFDTATKTDLGQAWGLAGLRAVRQATHLPLVAIGGINPTNASAVCAAGADGVAIVSAICAASDPAAAAKSISESFNA